MHKITPGRRSDRRNFLPLSNSICACNTSNTEAFSVFFHYTETVIGRSTANFININNVRALQL